MSAHASSSSADPAVVWHDVECGGYGGDLRLWEELASERPGPVLELGAGTGRVALHLARRGHRVVAVERDPSLAAELARRAAAAGLELEVIVADARELSLDRGFELILAAMQFLQLFLDAGERRALLAACRAHLAPRGLLAAAVIEGVPESILPPEPGDSTPLPDVRELEGVVYSSLPLGVSVGAGVMESRRRRERVTAGGEIDAETHVDRLALLDPARVEAEAESVGLRGHRRVEVAATEAHVGSIVLILRAVG
jgi:SAM-dependent methyltransferase